MARGLVLSQCLMAGRCPGLNIPYALRLGVLKLNIRTTKWYYAHPWTRSKTELLETAASSTGSVRSSVVLLHWSPSLWEPMSCQVAEKAFVSLSMPDYLLLHGTKQHISLLAF